MSKTLVRKRPRAEVARTAPPAARHPHRQWAPDATALNLIGDKWSLLIIRELVAGPVRFVDLQRQLDGISTEQLRSRLNRMVRDRLLTRQRYREVPPRVTYELTDKGRAALPIIAEMARFGLAFAWSEPRRTQRVRIASIFRLVLVTTDPDTTERFTMALTVEDEAVRPSAGKGEAYLLTFEGGERHMEKLAGDAARDPEADVVMTGTVAQWITALAPGGSIDELTVKRQGIAARDGAGARLIAQLAG